MVSVNTTIISTNIFDKTLLKKIGILAIPVMLSNLLQTLIMAIDTVMIGRLGPIPIAAVGMGNTIRLLLLIAVMTVAGGAISLMAQAKGSRDKARMSFVTRQSIIAGLILSIVLGGIGFLLTKPLLTLMNQGGELEAVTLGTSYLYVLLLGMPFLVLNILTNRLMQGAGDTVTPLILTIVVLILNVLFNYLFIFGWGIIPALGIVGAALGTIVARGSTAIISIWLFHSGKNIVQILPGTWRPKRQMVLDILSIGIPSGIQGVFRHASKLIVIGIATATSLGTYGAAVLTIATQIEQLIIQPIVGMNVAATSLIGQEMGKWQTKTAYQQGFVMAMLAFITMTIMILPIYFFTPEIIRIFDPSGHPKIMEGSISLFKITLWSLPVTAIGIILSGTLRGAGDTKPGMYSSIVNRAFIQLGLGWYLAFPMGLGFIGVWYGIVAGRVIDGLFLATVWFRKKWMRVALEKTDIYRTHLKNLSKVDLKQYLAEVRGPLMKEAGTEEIVFDQKVIYRGVRKEIIVQFGETGWLSSSKSSTDT